MKEAVNTITNSFFIRLGIPFTICGVLMLLMVFSEFEIEGLLIACGFFLLGFIFLLIGSFSIDFKKRKMLFGVSIIWIGFLLILSPLFLQLALLTKGFSWNNEMFQFAIGGTFFGFIFLFIGIIILNRIQEKDFTKEKIAGIKKRKPMLILLLSILTFGIYYILWIIKTRKEINSCGANIPTPWLLIIPGVSLYFEYKYAEGFSRYVSKDMDTQFWFLLILTLWPAAIILIQKELNKIAEY